MEKVDKVSMNGAEESTEAPVKKAERRWYVLRAVSGKEAKVKEYIEADIKNGTLNSKLVFNVLIPTEKVTLMRNGKKTTADRSYLPGYVLVEAILKGETPHILRNTPNVLGFLGGLDNPTPIKESDINRILGTVDEVEDGDQEIAIPYVIGDTVKVNNGPFSGFIGTIEEISPEKKKLKVIVKIFGRKTPLELDFMQVVKE